MFERSSLERNAYFVNRMKMSLAIPVQIVLNERKIKSISSDQEVVKTALRSVSNAVYDESLQMVTPTIAPRMNIVVIGEVEEQAFLAAAQSDLNNKEYKLMMNKLVFEKEEEASALVQAMQGKEIDGKKAQLTVEEECVYLSLYNKVHDQKTQQQMQGMDPNQMMMMNMMFMNPFLMMPFMQQAEQMNNFQKNKFFIRKSADPAPETAVQQSIIEEKITIQKKEPRKSKPEPERRESMRSNKTGKVVYYDTKKEEETLDTKIEMNLEQEEEKPKEMKVQYALSEMVRIFQGIEEKALPYTPSLDAFKEDGIINESFQTLELVQVSQITEEMKKMMLTSY